MRMSEDSDVYMFCMKYTYIEQKTKYARVEIESK